MEAILQAIGDSRFRKLDLYLPYGHPDTLCPDGEEWRFQKARGEWGEWSNKPWQFDFHKAGRDNQERMLMAANRPGKTACAAAEVAMHMTGRYPDWWEGKRFSKPVLVWTGSPTNETSRDIVQKALIGGTDKENRGTGFIPRDCLVGRLNMRQAGVTDVVDQFKARHVSGGVSTCILKTYEQGWRKWQGSEPDLVWLDEEPDGSTDQKRLYTEALTRVLTSHGSMMVTFTPLLGMTALVEHFQKGGAGVWLGSATWEDAPHLLLHERERLSRSYPDYEIEARTKGVPMLGEGRVFKVREEEIVVPPFEIPRHWAQICGIDFGADHPSAVAWLAHDRDADCLYLIGCWRKAGHDVSILHADTINQRGRWIPVAWPHDGANTEKGSGRTLRSYYIQRGVNLLARSACYKNDKGGSQPVWPIIEEITERMQTGRWKVFSTCTEWLEEFRSYHVKDGKLSKIRDDCLKASFYGTMMKRYAATMRSVHAPRKQQAAVFSTRM